MVATYRTSAALVAEILGNAKTHPNGVGDYDGERSLTAFIRGANLIVSRVATCASDRGYTLSTAELAEIEAWVAAYLYTRSDPIYQSKSTEGASAGFVSDSTATTERYKAGALALDPSGCLRGILDAKTAGAFWLGKAPSDQIDYEDRD